MNLVNYQILGNLFVEQKKVNLKLKILEEILFPIFDS